MFNHKLKQELLQLQQQLERKQAIADALDRSMASYISIWSTG